MVERKKIELTPQEERELFSQVIQQADIGVAVADLQGHLMFVNPAWAKMHGREDENLIGKHLKIFHAEDQMKEVNDFNEKVSKKGSHLGEVGHVKKDGTKFTAYMTTTLIKDKKGNPFALAGTLRDITKAKEIELALEESEEKYRLLVDNMSSGIVIYEAVENGVDFTIVNFNKAAERIENVNRKDVIGKKVTEVFPRVKDFGIFEVFQRVFKTGKPEHFPLKQYEDDRIKGWRDNYIFKLSNGEVVAIYEDVTIRKQIEDKLIESEKKYREIFEESPVSIFTTDKDGNVTSANPSLLELLGSPSEEVTKTYNVLTLPTIVKIGADKLFRKVLEKGEAVEVETEYVSMFDIKKYLYVKALPKFDEKQVTGMICLMLDMSEKKKAEEELKEREEQYQLMFEHASDGIITIDSESAKIIDCNQKMEEILGYSKKELRGILLSDIEALETPEEIRTHIEKIIEIGQDRFETKMEQKGGKIIDVEISASSFPYQGKKILLSFIRNITRRKEIEQQLTKRVKDAEVFMEAAVGRELEIKKLKKEIEYLKRSE